MAIDVSVVFVMYSSSITVCLSTFQLFCNVLFLNYRMSIDVPGVFCNVLFLNYRMSIDVSVLFCNVLFLNYRMSIDVSVVFVMHSSSITVCLSMFPLFL